MIAKGDACIGCAESFDFCGESGIERATGDDKACLRIGVSAEGAEDFGNLFEWADVAEDEEGRKCPSV